MAFLTTRMASANQDLLVIFCLTLLSSGLPLLSTMDRLSSSLKRSPRLLIESDIRVYWPSFLLMVLLLSAISLQAIYLTALYLVDGATSASFQSSVVFSGLCTFTHTLSSTHQWSSQLYLFPYSCFYRWLNSAHFLHFFYSLVLLLTALILKRLWFQLSTLILQVYPNGAPKI